MNRSILVILDGFGLAPAGPYNAITQAKAPTIKRLLSQASHSKLLTHGEDVGLPPGIMGNSEVGHMNIGSGRIVWQELSRINKEIREGKFSQNPNICSAIDRMREQGKRLHLLGLLSDGGVHSHQDHLFKLLEMCKERGLTKVSIHVFLDGRDTPPQSGREYLKLLEEKISALGVGEIATISGRYYAMDRDKRWDRVGLAYNCLWGVGNATESSALRALEVSYQNKINDEFVLPQIINKSACLAQGDECLFFNYRADRMREIVAAVGLPNFNEFPRAQQALPVTCFTSYDEHFPFPVAYAPNSLTHIMGEVIADAGLKQFRIAETEKYAHVTFFFNGGREAPMKGEERILIPSPRDVATYDQKPAMSAQEVTDKLVEAITKKEFSFLVANFANADMVGHSGIFAAAVAAVEFLDHCLSRIEKAAAENGYHLFISADHGNIEEMQDKTGQAHTQHTLNPVPFIYLPPDKPKELVGLSDGRLSDIMPTILETMGIPIPREVTGHSLFKG